MTDTDFAAGPHITDLTPPPFVVDKDGQMWTLLGDDYHKTEYTDTPYITRGTAGVALGVARAGRVPATHAQSSQEVPSIDWTPVSTILAAGTSARILSADPSRLRAIIRVRGTGTDGVWFKSSEFGGSVAVASNFDPTATYIPAGQSEEMPFLGAVYAAADAGNGANVLVSASVYRF